MNRAIILALWVLGVLALPATAQARRFVFEEEIIEGEVQKPEVTFSEDRTSVTIAAMAANARMAGECIKNPDRWARMIAPGNWTGSGT